MRLYTGTRSPEVEIRVKSYGAENLLLEEQFSEYLELEEHRETQAYLRIVSYTSNPVAVRLIEQCYARPNFAQQVME